MRIILTEAEKDHMNITRPKWILSEEKTESVNYVVMLSEWVLPTEIYDAGRKYQLYLVNKHLNNEN